MKHISLSLDSNQSNASTYLAVTGIVLSSSVLSIPNAHAARIAVTEVVIYEGEPIDYSNRDDVIFIDESSMYDDFSTMVSAPVNNSNNTNSYSNKAIPATTVAELTQPANQEKPQISSNAAPKKANAIALEAKKLIAPITQVKLSKPFDKSVSNTKSVITQAVNTKAENSKTKNVKIEKTDENPELAAFYANALKFERMGLLKKPIASKPKLVKKVSIKNIAQEKPKTKLASERLSLKTTKGKNSEQASIDPILNKKLNVHARGKDPELVAFYMDVFAKHNNNLSNQTRSAKTLTVKQIPIKIIAQKKLITKKKRNEVQLSLKTTTAKDPELIAFYDQVFRKDTKSKSKRLSNQTPVVVTSKAKDTELVAFYEREFGKGKSAPIMPTLKNRIISAVDVAAKTQSKNKSIAKKIVKKVKVKTSIDTEIAAIEKLIGNLQAQNII